MEVSPEAINASREEESKNPSETGLTQDFDNLALNSQQDDPTNDTANNPDEETKTSQKKKRARKGKGAAAKGEEVKDGPATRTRGRLAAFLAQKQQDQSLKKMRIGVVFDEIMMLHREHDNDHPERPERIMAIYLNLIKKDLFKQLVRINSEQAIDEDLLLAHKAVHIKHVREDG